MAMLRFTAPTVHNDYYKVNAFGRITSPGKFEGCFDFTPVFWEQALAGFASDEDAYGNFIFDLVAQDWHKWQHLQGYRKLILSEDEQGFVHHELRR